MFEDAKDNTKKISSLIDEYSALSISRESLLESIRRIEKNYKTGRIDYIRYQDLLEKETGKRAKDEAIKEYDQYLSYIARQIRQSNAEIFYRFYQEKTIPQLRPAKKAQKPEMPERLRKEAGEVPSANIRINEKIGSSVKGTIAYAQSALKTIKDSFASLAKFRLKNIRSVKPFDFRKVFSLSRRRGIKSESKIKFAEKEKPRFLKIKGEKAKQAGAEKGAKEKAEKLSIVSIKESVRGFFAAFGKKKPQEKGKYMEMGAAEAEKARPAKEVPAAAPKITVKKKTFFEKVKAALRLEKKPEKTLFEKILQEEGKEPAKKKEGETKLEFESITKMFRRLFRFRQKKVFSEKTELTPSIMGLREEEMTPVAAKERIESSLMIQEAKRVKELLKQHKEYEVYRPSSLGALANITVKKISFFLIEQFPDFFRKFHTSLRMANVPVLSNTYVNIMVFSSFLCFALSMFFYGLVKAAVGVPFMNYVFNAVLFGIAFAAGIFFLFYYYPENKIKSRRKSINANLPFAIDQMSAIVNSGIPPLVMFRLIAESEEYEEVSVEVNKIVLYADVFGYDLPSAVRTVAETTPSPTLKEFFEGMILSIETGSDLNHYLAEKSKEAMLAYRLERQKYVEAISTYSDIYTGILIAAPLFFVSTLSLVSMLGGTIGGMDVSTLMTYGTYAVIPGLNIAFIIFLQLSQPEI